MGIFISIKANKRFPLHRDITVVIPALNITVLCDLYHFECLFNNTDYFQKTDDVLAFDKSIKDLLFSHLSTYERALSMIYKKWLSWCEVVKSLQIEEETNFIIDWSDQYVGRICLKKISPQYLELNYGTSYESTNDPSHLFWRQKYPQGDIVSMKTGAKLFLEQAPCLISNNELLEDLQRFKEHLEIGLQSYSIDISKLHKLFKM